LQARSEVERASERIEGLERLVHNLVIGGEVADRGHQAGPEQDGRTLVTPGYLLGQPQA
jgi:hypothetical protein